MQHDVSSEPPRPPNVSPRLRMRRHELCGVILLALLPTGAVLGWFGPASGRAAAASGGLELEVVHPTCVRFHLTDRLITHVTNGGQEVLDTVVLSFSDSYLRGFSAARFTPALDEAHRLELKQLLPGETRIVSAEITAERYGLTRGDVVATAGSTQVAIPLSTFVFP